MNFDWINKWWIFAGSKQMFTFFLFLKAGADGGKVWAHGEAVSAFCNLPAGCRSDGELDLTFFKA
ncbi:hypothetical protein [Allobaculum sp. JKK-2023]|uniref:hypothetical protein n=1 Tax=Allobaculum sp. JKK-2023 TaxID=3108943 RepID=UPI002B0569F7|nr:hypothetical protein [Allobaculum sp. JKK-2023]